MPRQTRFFLLALSCVFAVAALVFSTGLTDVAAQHPMKSGGVVSTFEQPRWCKRLARKCLDGVDAACVAWGDYCAHRARGMKPKVWEPGYETPAEVKPLLDEELTESDAKPPTEEAMRLSETCGKLLGLCRKGNHVSCRVFAQKCVDTN